ncbi:unnamed protein product [Caenorhabditis auriculariae]|uniref:Uncharacterized protein n=1 Tax=Caenorhabditis auriculariae TaxID=2777116 RepID=A0A8S1H9N1_9PELO|nr:unnamed protein product [Caenorhabditis auriculariae]
MDLYAMIRSWIFLEEQTPQISYECKDLHYTQQEKKFFSENNGDALFLKYHKLFAALRINNCLTTSGAIRTFQENKLVPQEILNDIIVDQWNCLLKNEETPTVSNTMSEEVFNKSCLRSGRAIQEFPKSWRWTGFNFGTDVLLTASRLALTVKRNCVHQISPYSANMQGEKVLHYRLIIMDAEGKRIHDGKRISVALRPDQSNSSLAIDSGTASLKTENLKGPKIPFRTVRLKQPKRETLMENPFEDIATRAPPRDYLEFQRLRSKHHIKKKKRRHRKRTHEFLTRDDIVKPRSNFDPEEPTLPRKRTTDLERSEFQVGTRVLNQLPEIEETTVEEPKEEIKVKVSRLPNNPFRDINIREPTVLVLPIPESESEEERH